MFSITFFKSFWILKAPKLFSIFHLFHSFSCTNLESVFGDNESHLKFISKIVSFSIINYFRLSHLPSFFSRFRTLLKLESAEMEKQINFELIALIETNYLNGPIMSVSNIGRIFLNRGSL